MIEEVFVEADGLRFRGLASGPPGGLPLLLLHGFPEGAESWRPQLPGLAEQGFRAVAVDLRGYGGTGCPADEADYELPKLVADIEGLLRALGWSAAHIAGHDWGALIGWVFVSQHPERVRSWTSLSIGHPVPLARSALEDPDQRARSAYIGLFRQRGRAEAILAEDGHRRLREMYRRGPNPDAIPPDVIDELVAGFARPGRLTAALNYYRVALPAVAGAMREVRAPTLLAWGDGDPALGALAPLATERHVEGPYRFEVLRGAGHWLQYERPEAVLRLLSSHCLAHEGGGAGGTAPEPP